MTTPSAWLTSHVVARNEFTAPSELPGRPCRNTASRVLCQSAGSTRLRGVSLKLRGEVAERQGRFDDALTLVATARDLFATSGDMIDETAAMVGAGRIHLMRSHYEAAQAAYRPVIDRMKNGADPWLERIVKLHVAAIQMSLGNFADAADSAERSLELCRRYGNETAKAMHCPCWPSSAPKPGNTMPPPRHLRRRSKCSNAQIRGGVTPTV